MAGFRTFATGEVLTAANVNDFLMKQSVMVFADATARTAALGAEVTEGMLTFNLDTGALEVFDGSDFVPAGAEPNLVAVKSAIKTDTFVSGSVAAGDNVAVPDLEITHQVADADNRLIFTVMLGITSTNVTGTGIAVHDGTDFIAIGDADGNRSRVSSAFVTNMQRVATFVHTPGTGSKTYTVRIFNITGSAAATLFVNRHFTDDNNPFAVRAVSSLIIQEVKV